MRCFAVTLVALIGIACDHSFCDSSWVYALAQMLNLGYILSTKTVHPPADANPLVVIYSHSGRAVCWQPVFVGVFSLAVVAAISSRLCPAAFRAAPCPAGPLATNSVLGWGDYPSGNHITLASTITSTVVDSRKAPDCVAAKEPS